MREARRAAHFVVLALVCAGSAALGDDVPDPALLEFLGASARAEGSGVDVDRLVDARLADAGRGDRTRDEVNERPEGDDG